MKLNYLIPVLLWSALCHAQTPFVPNLELVTYSFSSDSLSIKNLNMLSKITLGRINDAAIMPLGYNWTKDVRLSESIKRMSLDTRRIDSKGREIPVDVFRQVQNEVLFKSVTTPN